jgi:hypothetical protein
MADGTDKGRQFRANALRYKFPIREFLKSVVQVFWLQLAAPGVLSLLTAIPFPQSFVEATGHPAVSVQQKTRYRTMSPTYPIWLMRSARHPAAPPIPLARGNRHEQRQIKANQGKKGTFLYGHGKKWSASAGATHPAGGCVGPFPTAEKSRTAKPLTSARSSFTIPQTMCERKTNSTSRAQRQPRRRANRELMF